MKRKEGYGMVYQDIMRNKNLSAEAKAIYAYLSSIAGMGQSCYPSVEIMQKELCMSKNRLMRHMGQLIAFGVVEKARERNGNIYGRNVYRITHEVEVANDLKCIFEAVENKAIEKVQNKAIEKVQKVQNEAVECRAVENEATNNNSTTINKKDNNIKVQKSVKLYFPDDEDLNQAFTGYVEMRKQLKKPMTDRAIGLAIKKLHELAAVPFSDTMDKELAVRILNQSVMNSWQGLFPLNEQKTVYQDKKGGGMVEPDNQSRGQASDFYVQFMGLGNGD